MSEVMRRNGKVEWTHEPTDKYVVTGIDRNGKRFRIVTGSWMHAAGINVWQGSKWLIRGDKRYRLQTISN